MLRRLDHPNIIKLEGIITSRLSSSIYLVFEYMEHDISGLLSCPGIKFTEAQVCSFQISFFFFFSFLVMFWCLEMTLRFIICFVRVIVLLFYGK